MINMPTPAALLEFQVQHYTQRLAEARSIKERMFIRRELYNLKKQNA